MTRKEQAEKATKLVAYYTRRYHAALRKEFPMTIQARREALMIGARDMAETLGFNIDATRTAR